jgi:two-component system, NtrC family, response regulator
MLATHFVVKFADELQRPNLTIQPETIRFLTTLPWEGNIRELENTIERAAVLCSAGVITPEDVQPETAADHGGTDWAENLELEQLIPTDIPLPDVLNTLEKKLVAKALEKSDNVQTKAAESLGITKSLLQYKMKKYGLHKK